MFLALALCAIRDEPDPFAVPAPAPLAPPAWPEPSPLVSDLVGAQLRNLHQFFDEAKAGLPLDAAGARMQERGEAIYDELVDGRGPEAHAAWVDALERIQYVLALFGEHFGVQAT